MKKNLTKVLALVLALIMVVSLFAGCKKDEVTTTTEPAGTTDTNPTDGNNPGTEVDALDFSDWANKTYDEQSAAIYDYNLGEFYEAYEVAKEETEDISKRFALMAVAEAKLLEAAVMLPCTTDGGLYAISRVVPYTAPWALWGNDSYRYHQILVTTEPLKSEHRTELKEKWAELKGTETYMDWAKNYLAENNYTLKDSYVMGYTEDPSSWDILATSRAVDSEPILNTYDGLYEYDNEGIQQPALAETYSVSDDGLVYTFKLREGLKWVDSQGREVAEVTADDFVAGMQHMMDAMGGLEYLVEGLIVNADKYIGGDVTDFSEVGVKAVDKYTVEYTLEHPAFYFMSMLGYGVFAPMNRSYYQSQGGAFGADFDPSAETYLYGTTPDNIAYCGPYLVTNYTKGNTIVYKANESYWNADNINIKSITWLYNDLSDAMKAYNDMKAGTIDGCSLNASALEVAKGDGWFDEYGYVSLTSATSYMAFLNLNRAAFANANDETTVVSNKTDDQKSATLTAINNVHFRRALMMSVDRASYNAQVAGEDVKLNALRNAYIPGNFVSLEEDVTIDINGTPTTFPAETSYGAIVQAQLDADGVLPVVAFDVNADDGLGSSDGYDGWYNPEAAAAELAVAIEELKAQGLEISAENPIYIDYPYPMNNEYYTNKAAVLKQSVEEVLGGAVIINMVACNDTTEWMYAGYGTQYGYEANYDIYDLSGWGPDYADPSTYLDTFLPDYAGYMCQCIGIY